MIIYFSGTGNSRYCAQYLAHHLGEELLDAGHYIRNQIAADLITGKPWIFVCPTYAWQLPRIFADFIRSGNFAGSTDAYFIMTCGDDIGDAAAYIKPLCQEKGLRFHGVLQVVMPENYIARYDVPDEKESLEIIARARPVLREAVNCIRMEEDLPEVPVTLDGKAKSSTFNAFFYRTIVKDKDFFVKDSCISCGKCAEGCVRNNIRLENGKPVWGGHCTHCMACICGCPVEAIEYGKKSKGKPRYQCPEYHA